MAQVVIGGAQPPADVEIFRPQPALPTHGEWPYTVKTSNLLAAQKPVDPNTLPSRQVNAELLQAARLQQSGLTPAQVRESMAKPELPDAGQTAANQPLPPMEVPMLAGDKPAVARDSGSTLPAVATGPLMASLATNGADNNSSGNTNAVANTAALAATPNALTVAADQTQPLIAPMPSAALDAAPADPAIAMPNSMAMLPDTTAVIPAAAAPEKPATSGRALFGGRKLADQDRIQVAAAKTDGLATPVAMDSSEPAPQAAPALDVAATPTPPAAAPRDTASNSTPAQIAPLTSLSSAPPKLLARIGDQSRGAVQRPDRSANESTAPLATPATPVETVLPDQRAPEPAPQPVPEPVPEPVQTPAAVLPAKADEPSTPVFVPPPAPEPTPEPPESLSDPIAAPEGTAIVPVTLPVVQTASAKPAPRKGFWNRMFGSDDAQPQSQPAVLNPDELPTRVIAVEQPAAIAPATVGQASVQSEFVPIPSAGLAAPDATANVPAEPAPRPKPEDRERTAPPPSASTVMVPSGTDSGGSVNPAMLPGANGNMAPMASAAPVITTQPMALTEPTMVATPLQPVEQAIPVAVSPVASPMQTFEPAVMAPVAPTMFRVETPATAGQTGLVTPRLVPVTQPAVAAIAPAAQAVNAAPLAQIKFLPASQSVDSVGQAQLQAIAEAMQMGPQTRLLLNAYAEASNEGESRRISLNRALVVRSKLAELGIQPSRIDVQALGENQSGNSDGGRDRVDALLH